jgi:cytoskeletal protein CcmA (bactofilin family)
MRWVATLAAACGGLLLGGAHGQAQQHAPAAYAVLGLEDVALRARARISGGDVAANRGAVTLGAGVRVAGAVAADTIRIRRGARAGDLFCRLIEGTPDVPCGSLTVPIVDVATLSLVQVVPGAAEVRVPARAGTAPLEPGAYGAVEVGARGRLLLAGGSYAVRSITIAAKGRLLCASPCRLAVQERVVLASGARVGVAAPLDARALRIDVEASGHGAAVTTRARATISGTVYAPGGNVVLGGAGRYEGAFIGRTVRVGAGARITGTSSP